MEKEFEKTRAPLSTKEALKIDENEISVEELDSPKAKFSILQKIAPYLVGSLAFLFGLVLFFPLEEFTNRFIATVGPLGNQLEFQDLSISKLGNFEVKNLRYSFLRTQSQPSQGNQRFSLKIPSVEGEISFFKLLLSDTIDSRFSASSFELNILSDHSLFFKGADLAVIIKGKNFKNIPKNFDGSIQVNAVNILGNYDIILPTIGEELGEFTITNIIAEATVKRGIISFKNFQIESSLGTVKVSGSLPASLSQGPINLTVTIYPAPLLKKYSEFNLEYNLKNTLQMLHDDGSLIYICKDSFDNCHFQKKQT